MCGRFNVIDNPELRKLLQELGIDLSLPTRTNVAPTEPVPLVRRAEHSNELTEVRWWLTPHWAKQLDQKYSMFNARCETLATSRAFAEPFRRRRGIVPMSAFIEWRTEEQAGESVKQPYLIEARHEALAIAALWDRWEGGDEPIESCALITTEAAPEFREIHNRMPLILVADERARWLDVSCELDSDDPLFAPALKVPLCVQPVSRGINNARNKAVEFMAPTGDGYLLGAAG
jgi:putative SOS response-associated peptidase YedK